MVNLRNCEISVRKKVKILVEGDKMDLDQDIFSKDNAYFFHDNIFFFFFPLPPINVRTLQFTFRKIPVFVMSFVENFLR